MTSARLAGKLSIARGRTVAGLRLVDDIAVGEVTTALRDRHLLCVPAADNVLRLLPPLNISEDELLIAYSALEHYFSELAAA